MTLTKQHILSEIQRLATIYGGRLSFRKFCEESGLKEHQILGMHWARWNDALAEAGVKNTNSFFQPKTDDDAVIEAIAQFIKQLGKWPTDNDLLIERRRNEAFPSIKVIRRVRATSPLAPRIVSYCGDQPNLSTVAQIAEEIAKKEIVEHSSSNGPSISGYVYLMKTGRRYKIGRTNSPSRRHREVRLELPDPTTVIHTIATDDPSGVESYWHNRFKEKRIRDTEFFELVASDVAAFKRWKRIA